MTQIFNFEVNIERLNPHTGQLLYVDRMTSDYAQAHPFDVDGYLEQVYQKWVECETPQFRETREALRKMWNAVLGDMNPRGNASLYPNAHGPHPALMEVWHKAGDFWRRGLRAGDTLPDRLPMCKIQRLQDGSWISLSDKDKHLLEQPAEQVAEQPKPKRKAKKAQTSAPMPQQLDLFGEPIETSFIDDAQDQSNIWKKIGASVALVAIILILVNTMGLFGLAAIGLIAGGVMK